MKPISTDDQRTSPSEQLKFAEVAFRNNQDLVRFIDQKASLMITAVGVLTTALGALLIRALNAPTEEPWQITVRLMVSGVVLTYMLMAFVVIGAATKVLAPSAKPLRAETRAPALLFPLTLLVRSQENEDLYYERLSNATPNDLLLDYSNQIVEIAHIYRIKQRQLSFAVRHFRALSLLWIATILLLATVAAFVT